MGGNHLLLRQNFPTEALLTFLPRYFFFVLCTVEFLSNILGLYLLDASSTPSRIVTVKNVLDIAKLAGGGGGAEQSPVENHPLSV